MVYDSQGWVEKLPCLNQSCKSHGSPHPNCQCYQGSGAFAEGGSVGSFCSSTKTHNPDCQYYQDGGDAIPDSEVTLDAPQTQQPQAETIPDNEVQLDAQQPASPDIIPDDEVTPDDNASKYGTTGQQIVTGLEGVGQGATFGLSTKLETMAGVPAEDIAARQEENPLSHIAGQMTGVIGSSALGIGEGELLGAAGLKAAQLAGMGKFGSGVIKGAVESGMMQGGDELSKTFLGQQGEDPGAAVGWALAHIGAAALLGGAVGGSFSASATGLRAIGNAQLGSKAQDFLNGVAIAKGSTFAGATTDELKAQAELWGNHVPSFMAGAKFSNEAIPKFMDKFTEQAVGGTGALVAKGMGYGIGGEAAGYQLSKSLISPLVKPIVSAAVTPAAQKYLPDVIFAALGNNKVTGLLDVLDHAGNVSSGLQRANRGIEALFKSGTQQVVNQSTTDRNNARLKDFIENGGLNQQIQTSQGQQQQQQDMSAAHYADGGEVVGQDFSGNSTPPANMVDKGVTSGLEAISDHYPAQGMMMGMAKSRINAYLNQARPQPPTGVLPFDTQREDPAKSRAYDRAIDIANNPLSVLNHIQDGTLTPEHMKHLTGMYPELYQNLQKKMTERITKAQIDDEAKPPYKVRQGMSLFMGAALDSTFTPGNIQAAQGVFAQAQATPGAGMPPPPTKNKKGTNSLSKTSEQYQTRDQAAQSRSQNGH